METKIIPKSVNRDDAFEVIYLTLQRFSVLINNIRGDPRSRLYDEKLIRIMGKLDKENYYMNVNNFLLSGEYDRLSSEGIRDLLLKLRELSQKFCLKVEIPEDVSVIAENVIEKFISELTQLSLNILEKNKTELTKKYNELLTQTSDINLKNQTPTDLELSILKAREYKIAKRNADYASNELMNMASSSGSGASYDEKEYAHYQQIYNENSATMNYIKRTFPLVTFLNGKEDKKSVEQQLGKAYNEINKALDSLIKRIHEGTYPIWHFDTLAEQLLEKYAAKEKQVIQEELNKMKKKEELTDLLLTIGPMVLSVAVFLIPGGASFILLGLRAGLQVANAAVGVMSAVNDVQDAIINKEEAYASLKISPELRQLMTKENCDIKDAKFQYVVALVSSGFVVFDVMDAVDAFNLIKKCGQLDDATRAVLKQSKRFGEKVFKSLDVPQIKKLAKLPYNQFQFISDLPTEELILFGKKFEQLSDVAVDSVKDLPVDLLIEIKKLEPNDINAVAELADGKTNLMEAVFKEREALVSGKSLEELVTYFKIPYTPKEKSLTMYQTRIWYKWRETKIPGLMKDGDSLEILEANARKAFEERNFIRQKARDCMLNRAWAEQLQLKEGNLGWNELLEIRQLKYDNNMKTVYQSIIESSQKSRPGVDHMYGL